MAQKGQREILMEHFLYAILYTALAYLCAFAGLKEKDTTKKVILSICTLLLGIAAIASMACFLL